MGTLRVAVSFPEESASLEEQERVLNELMQDMKGAMGLNERLTRLPELTLPGQQAPDPSELDEVAYRVFQLEFPDETGCEQVLRAVGGWYMRNPWVMVSFKADGPGGGINLRLSSFSTVAFAQAVARLKEHTEPQAEDGAHG
jgi:hypothetical protein